MKNCTFGAYEYVGFNENGLFLRKNNSAILIPFTRVSSKNEEISCLGVDPTFERVSLPRRANTLRNKKLSLFHK